MTVRQYVKWVMKQVYGKGNKYYLTDIKKGNRAAQMRAVRESVKFRRALV